MKTTEKKRAVLYTRVASNQQDNEQTNISLASQEMRLKEYCKKKNIEVVEVYSDSGTKGGFLYRPSYERFLNDLKSKKITDINYLLITELSRFSRNFKDLIEQQKTLKKFKVELNSVFAPDVDANHVNNLMEEIHLSIAKSETERRSQKIKDGIKAAKEKKLKK